MIHEETESTGVASGRYKKSRRRLRDCCDCVYILGQPLNKFIPDFMSSAMLLRC